MHLDTILAAGHSKEQHSAHLFDRFHHHSKRGAPVNAEKFELGKPSLTDLGYTVSPSGIVRLPDKVKAIQDHSEPQSYIKLRHLSAWLISIGALFPNTLNGC